MREDRDGHQEDIAAILSITRQQYQLYESGKREIPLHHLITLAHYYNVSLDYLAGITNTPRTLNGEPYQVTKKITIGNNSGKINIKA